MIYHLATLLNCVNSVSVEINGKWVPARGSAGPFRWRLKAAWMVLTGKADAVVWPEGQ